MATLKPLLDAECGTINPLVKLSQIYTCAPQDGLNEYYKPIIAPNTFHLESLLTNLRVSDKTMDKLEYEWTKEFFNSLSDDAPFNSINNISSERMLWNEQTYIPPPPVLILHPNPIFLDQPSSLIDTGFDHGIVKATQNILSFLQERQFADNAEDTNEIIHRTKEAERHDDWRIDSVNPFEEGLKCLEVHDIANAILFFEAAVRKEPAHIDAWLCLGITQTENEQDGPAIAALKKCVELDPKNSQAYITLASCYANESLIKEAFDSLYNWLVNNAQYSHLLSNRPSFSTTNNELTFEELKDLFLRAVSLSNISHEIDSDLQVCLGILFYLNDDYHKATECFYTAILAKPHDALLWNKLGTSIANGGQNEKAVHAYYHALRLSPGFIRARYNLGISCLNLNAYQQAIEHFLIALRLQNNSIGTQVYTSENIWRTLASAIDRLKRSDLEQCVVYRDLSKLLREFQIE